MRFSIAVFRLPLGRFASSIVCAAPFRHAFAVVLLFVLMSGQEAFARPFAYLVKGGNEVRKVDVATGHLVASQVLPDATNAEGGVAISPAGHTVYVTDTRGGAPLNGIVYVLDADTLAVRTQIPVGFAPEGI